MVSISVARKIFDEKLICGFFLVDLSCLGVKDTFLERMSLNEYKNMLKTMNTQFEILYTDDVKDKLIDCDYALAHNVIYAGIRFAAKFGLTPHNTVELHGSTVKYL